MKTIPVKTSSTQIYLVLLLVAMLIVTWAVGLLLVPEANRDKTYYLALVMLSVAEILSIFHTTRMSGNKVKLRNMPLQIGGSVMLLLYVLAVGGLTVAAVLGIGFNWLLALHAISLIALLIGWTIVAVASNHAKNQDKKDGKRMESFAAIRERYGEFCYRLESESGCVDPGILHDAFHIRDEILRFARSDSTPGLERFDREIESQLASLENMLARIRESDDRSDRIAEMREGLKKMQLAIKRRDSGFSPAK